VAASFLRELLGAARGAGATLVSRLGSFTLLGNILPVGARWTLLMLTNFMSTQFSLCISIFSYKFLNVWHDVLENAVVDDLDSLYGSIVHVDPEGVLHVADVPLDEILSPSGHLLLDLIAEI